MVGFIAFRLQEIAIGKLLGKGTHHDIIGYETGIAYAFDILDMQRVCPQSILTHVRNERRNDYILRECQLFTLLIKEIVAVGILQSIYMILARSYTLDDEVPTTIGLRYT